MQIWHLVFDLDKNIVILIENNILDLTVASNLAQQALILTNEKATNLKL